MKYKSSQLICFILVLFSVFFLSGQVHANIVKQKFEEATIAYGKKEFKKAIRLYEETLQIYPKFAPAYNFLALCHKEIGADLSKVQGLLDQAIAIDPTYALAYDNLGKIYYNIGEFDKAEENVLLALKHSPQLVSAQLTAGWTYLMGLEEPDEAIKYFKEVADEHRLAYAYFGLGIAYFMDDQRLMMMDVITHLRDIGEEGFAQQLEQIVRTGEFIPPTVNNAPLIAPKSVKSRIISDDIPSLADVKPLSGIPVRIRKTKLIAENSFESNVITGEDRIRQLQNNRQP